MAKQEGISLQRLAFLFTLVAVFLYTYMADLNIFAVVVHTVGVASFYLQYFALLFLVVSFMGLSIYYYCKQLSNKQISTRFLKWLRVFSLALFVCFVISAMFVYLNIYFDTTFDL